MRVLGLTLGRTRVGRELRDGAACVVEDGEVRVAIAEERVARTKHAGGFTHALGYCLNACNLSVDDFDAIVVSSCCEACRPRKVDGLDVRDPAVVRFAPSHHLSHACSAFCVSPFDRALVVVMDSGGNIIGAEKHSEWWKNRREQNTYYIGEGATITAIGRDFDEPFEVGFGEAYRCFTYYLGWPSSTYAGNTMALAAYGDPKRFAGVRLFEFKDGRLGCQLRNDPLRPIEMLREWAREHEVDIGEPRIGDEEITQEHKDLACLIQNQLEEALVAKVSFLSHATGIKNLCIAGGVGLNCVANTRILQNSPIRHIFVQPAAGDQGQALGNALFGYHYLLRRPRKFEMTNPYFGKDYSGTDYSGSAQALGNPRRVQSSGLASETARLLAAGAVVGWFQGRSEYGPRALGHRSILADPRRARSKQVLDQKIKHREWFRPYAPSVLREHSARYFDISCDSPFMLLVATVKPAVRSQIPSVVHVDGSARLQTVALEDDHRFYELIDAFGRLTGVPMLLNTSFNRRGEPIVETPDDAIRCFDETEAMDALVIGDHLFTKARPIQYHDEG